MAWLAWPSTVIPIAIIFFVMFRKPIADRLAGLKELSSKGAKFEESAKKQMAITKDPAQSPLEAIQETGDSQETSAGRNGAEELLSAMPLSPVLQMTEEIVRTGLRAKGLDETGPTVDVLVRYLAGTTLLLDFEQIHSAIFGSQIYLLKRLNEVRGSGQAWEFIEDHFDKAKEQYPRVFVDWTVDRYMRYLEQTDLVLYGDERRCHITKRGLEFLQWVVNNGRLENKGG